MVLTELAPYLVLNLNQWEIYGLFFLLGSFTVASLSDLRHLSAQREFLEVWALFVVALLAFDLWVSGPEVALPFFAKWGLIGIFSLLSWERVGGLFRLARADVAALAAAAALLAPFMVLVFYLLAKALSWPMAPLLRRGRDVYPFLPVVAVTTIALMAISLYVVPRFLAL